MAEYDIHEPQLPGVKTFARDSAHETPKTDSTLGVIFGGKGKTVMTTPETSSLKEPGGSILTNKGDIFNVSRAFSDDHVETGTIVTDKRHAHRSIGSTLKAAFDEWWGETSTKLQKIELVKKQEYPTVQKAETRKEIIAQAAQHTRQVPRDDHTIVVEKLKTLSHDAERVTGKPYIIKKPLQKANSEIQLGYAAQSSRAHPHAPEEIRGAETLDLRKVAVAPTIERNRIEENRAQRDFIAHTPKTEFMPHPTPADTETTVRPFTTPETSARPTREWKLDTPTHTPHETLPVAPTVSVSHTPEHIITHAPNPEPVITVSTRSVEIPKALHPKIQTAPAHIDAHEPERQMSSIELHVPQENTVRKLVSVLIFASVIIVGAVGGIYAGISVSKNTDVTKQPSLDNFITPPAFFTPDRTVPLAATPQKATLLQTLTESVHSAQSGVTQFYIVEGEATKTNPNILTATQFFELIQPRVDTRFIRALEDTVMIGSVDTGKKEPFLILKSNAFDTAFAGMLQWEQFMQEDLAPFFGTHESSAERFVDALAQNRSIRILTDTAGNEVLIYAFVSRDTIIITPSIQALSAVVSRI